MNNNKKEKKCDKGSPAWMTTYGDMITLLLTFFVLIVSFSSIDVEMFQKALGSLKGAFGIKKAEERATSLLIRPIEGLREKELLLKTVKDVEEFLKHGKVPRNIIQMSYDLNGVYLTVNDSLLFENGKAELKSQASQHLQILADILKKEHNINIEVRGHTDDTQISTDKYPSNWELSTARSVTVVRYFQEECGIIPRRLSAIGMSQYHPKVENDCPKNKAKNRRVEIYLKILN